MNMISGLEIHQQLNTKTKLFCSCKNELDDNYKFEIIRKLRGIYGESGEIDIAAKYETMKNRDYIYRFSDEYACLVELDEEPPHHINIEALKTAILFAEYFNMYIPKVLQIMRKIIVDGSNTSGFQRTLLLGLNGYINYNNKKIRITTLCLEEDASRKIDENENYIIYNLDRLGIPLVEISTGPDINNPKELKEVAEYIGLILRLSGNVKRGLGTIRQDVNISIPNGTRVEIKGVQDLNNIDKIAEQEILRQEKILEWMKLVKDRNIEGYELSE